MRPSQYDIPSDSVIPRLVRDPFSVGDAKGEELLPIFWIISLFPACPAGFYFLAFPAGTKTALEAVLDSESLRI